MGGGAEFALWAMLVPACIVLCIATLCFLVQKKADDTCLHIHTAATPTWRHAGHVKKNASATPKQTQKNVAATKQSFPIKQTCGTVKTAAPT